MSVATLLRKEKDGTLGSKHKLAQFYGPILPFTDQPDKGAAPSSAKKKPGYIPSMDDPTNPPVKREEGRSFAHTEEPRGTSLLNIAATNYPAERT